MKESTNKNMNDEQTKSKNKTSNENIRNKKLILVRWHGYEDDGSSGCYNYNYKQNK